MTRDEQYLRLLSIFHYVVGGITALIGCFPIIHFGVGVVILFAPEIFGTTDPPPRWVGMIFAFIAAMVMAGFWALAAATIATGRFLVTRRNYWFCVIFAGVECVFGPFGTVLGVFTIIVLMQDSVRQLFGVDSPPPSAPASNPFGPVQP